MSAFNDSELAYLGERRLERIATVGKDGTPHVVPVGMWRQNPENDAIDSAGREFERSSGLVLLIHAGLVSGDDRQARAHHGGAR